MRVHDGWLSELWFVVYISLKFSYTVQGKFSAFPSEYPLFCLSAALFLLLLSCGPVWLLSLVKWCLFHIMSPWGSFSLHTFLPHLLCQPGDCRLAMIAHCVRVCVFEWLNRGCCGWKCLVLGADMCVRCCVLLCWNCIVCYWDLESETRTSLSLFLQKHTEMWFWLGGRLNSALLLK